VRREEIKAAKPKKKRRKYRPAALPILHRRLHRHEFANGIVSTSSRVLRSHRGESNS
jgi:hypothetical protein